MNRKAEYREILARMRWPDRRQRAHEDDEVVRGLTPTERRRRVTSLTRLCLNLAAAAGNLEVVRRHQDWREAQWHDRIREVIRLHEHRQQR